MTTPSLTFIFTLWTCVFGLLAANAATTIEEVVAEQQNAWNEADADRWGSVYLEDSGFVNILGMHYPNRALNVARHAELFTGIFEGSTITVEIERITPIGESHVHVETIFTLSDHKRLPPGIVETEPGKLLTRMHYVMAETDGQWEILFAQNTAISPLARRKP